jgi:PAS domain S-box-containing protein
VGIDDDVRTASFTMMASRWSRIFRRLVVVATVCVCLPAGVFAQEEFDEQAKRVLALHVVRRDSPSFDDTFRSVLLEGLSTRLDYYSEFIDLNRINEEKYQSALRSYLRTRYVDGGFDLVIASGPSVVEFLSRDPSVFEGVPIVFTTRQGVLAGPPSTGIVSAIDFKNTLAAALAVQPTAKHVFVISGVGTFDKLYADLFRTQCAEYASRVSFQELSGLPLPQIRERVRQLPADAMIFYLSITDDGAGRKMMPLDAITSIAEAANAPVYSWHEDALGQGIVGGRLHSSINDARMTAQLALRVLHGERPETIPVVNVDSYAYQFDWRQLQRWQIDESLLPPGSVIRYRNQSFIEQYRAYVVGGGLVFAGQGLLIAGLLIQRRRRRHAEDALRHSETRNSAILRAIPDLMFVIDRDGTYLDFHVRDEKHLFVSPDSFLGRKVTDVMPPELADMFMKALERTRTSVEPVVIDYELTMGELRHYEARLVPADNGRVVSIVRDVTEPKRAIELNHALAGRIIVSQEQERQRIARELHDDLSQKMALLNLEVAQIADQVPLEEPRTRLVKLSSQVGEIANDLSDLSHKLHPSRLQALGLKESVRLLCDEITEQRKVNVVFRSAEIPRLVDPGVSLCLYRITQEALHNVAKHSRARHASVELTREGNHLHLQITDSGIGFDPVAVNGAGLGLVSMRERVGVLKGNLSIHASPGAGTRIGVRVPLAPLQHEGQSIKSA